MSFSKEQNKRERDVVEHVSESWALLCCLHTPASHNMSESGCRDLFSICSSGRLHQAEQPPKLGFHTGSVSSTQDKGLVVLWRINPLRWIKLLMLDWPFRVTHRHFKNFATNFNSEVFWPENHQINGADKVTADWRTGRRSDSLGQSTSPAGLQRAAPLWPGASHTLHLEEPGRTWKTSSGFCQNTLDTRQQKLQTTSHSLADDFCSVVELKTV